MRSWCPTTEPWPEVVALARAAGTGTGEGPPRGGTTEKASAAGERDKPQGDGSLAAPRKPAGASELPAKNPEMLTLPEMAGPAWEGECARGSWAGGLPAPLTLGTGRAGGTDAERPLEEDAELVWLLFPLCCDDDARALLAPSALLPAWPSLDWRRTPPLPCADGELGLPVCEVSNSTAAVV
jgi:hypothetical protein